LTLGGLTGTLVVNAGATADSVQLSGSATDVLRLSGPASPLAADQDTPVRVPFEVRTSLADTYTLTADAPAGWTVAFDASGALIATPAPGLQGGTYPVLVTARSK